ncbi:MAG TPA: hypothetical protein VF185_04395 [Patescibacteria group bacterium]
MKKKLLILLVLAISVPAFWRMLQFGIYSMQDFPYIRLVELDKCFRALQIPCRWAQDVGAGYGEPLFNFYGQVSFAVGEIFHLVGFSKIDSLKIAFTLSFVMSAFAMFLLAKKIWKSDWAAIVSSAIYLYAPYRAVDVWVRGDLAESMSFVFFPLIILEIENYLSTKKKTYLVLFSLFFALLLLNHSLSVVLFLPFLIGWTIFRLLTYKNVKPFVYLAIAGLFSFVISAFYILPVIFESKFVDIGSTTSGYFDWRANFVTIGQLFVSRFWGYGGSVWGTDDGLSLSVGQIQWVLPFLVGLIVLLRRKFTKDVKIFVALVLIGVFALFLTHNKSTFIWNNLMFMKYIQFPWRFLSVAVFSFALASGLIVKYLGKFGVWMAVVVVVIAIALNYNFFRPDIWKSVTDSDLESGAFWTESRFASINDYWPNFGHKLPDKISDGKYINYFPGWNYQPDKNGLIPADGAVFSDTPVRTVGNWVSVLAVVLVAATWKKFKYEENKK